MQKTFEQTVDYLAHSHSAIEPMLQAVYLSPDEQKQEIRLIEVSHSFSEAGVYPFFFKPQPPEIPFRVGIVQLHPNEWQAVLEKRLHLPVGWGEPEDLLIVRENEPAKPTKPTERLRAT